MENNLDLNTSRTVLYRNTKCCEECKESSSLNLKKLSPPECKSAPTSYSPKSPQIKEQIIMKEELEKGNANAVTLRDATKTRFKKVDHIEECPYRRRCYQCRDLVVRIRSLLDEIKAIKRNKSTGVICDFCNRLSSSGKCKRCEFLANRYKISETIDDDARQQRFKIWLCKVNQFLNTILERETCKHNVYPRSAATDELTHLLHELKSPLTVREPDIGYFPSIDSLENITESKDILEQVLMRLKSNKKSEDFFTHTRTSCICKYFSDKKFDEKLLTDEEKEILSETTLGAKELKDIANVDQLKNMNVKETKKIKAKPVDEKKTTKEENKHIKDEKKHIKDEKKTTKDETKPMKDEKKTTKDEKKPREDKKPKDKEPKEEKLKKSKVGSEENLMAQMMKKNAAKKGDRERPAKALPPPPVPKIAELPTPVRKVKKIVDKGMSSVSESFAECNLEDGEPTEMVKGHKIVPIEPRKGLDTGSVEPMLFKVQPECPSLPDQHDTPTITTPTSPTATTEKAKKAKEKTEVDERSSKGVIRYMLSNREFIEKGWTLLPTTKIMRRMNIYKMLPANPKFDWFARHKTQRLVYYDTGEKFAEIQEDGCGKWFYKNGMLALDYYCAKDTNSGFRYVVYSSGDNTDVGRRLPVTVLASFDYLGNGVVYDHYGNERLKYNQSEGIVIDEKIGPQGRWKWHTLNEPPVLQPVFVDNRVRPTGCLEDVVRGKKDDDRSDPGSKHKKEPNLDMLAIELENFMKEKADKLLQEFKPFQIKMKALKVNDQFSLKVLDQASIYLMFRDGQTSIKLNLGMLLISNEIVDTDTSEVTQVATPYDRHPAKSDSIVDIQNALEKARKLGKARSKLRN